MLTPADAETPLVFAYEAAKIRMANKAIPGVVRWADLLEAEAALEDHIREANEPIEPRDGRDGYRLDLDDRLAILRDDEPETIPFRPRTRPEPRPA